MNIPPIREKIDGWVRISIPIKLQILSETLKRMYWIGNYIERKDYTYYDFNYYFRNEDEAIMFKLKFGL